MVNEAARQWKAYLFLVGKEASVIARGGILKAIRKAKSSGERQLALNRQ